MTRFDQILDEAIAAWPPRFALRIRRLRRRGHILLGLVDLSDDVTRLIEGNPREVLLTNMHWAIVTVANRAAASWTLQTFTMRPDELRRDWIREKFEDDLRLILSIADRCGWPPDDVVLVEKYFAETKTR